MNTTYSLVRQAYEEANERRSAIVNNPYSLWDVVIEADKAFMNARANLVSLVEAI